MSEEGEPGGERPAGNKAGMAVTPLGALTIAGGAIAVAAVSIAAFWLVEHGVHRPEKRLINEGARPQSQPPGNGPSSITATSPQAALASIFSSEIFGSQIGWAESKVGPAKEVRGREREYEYDGCTFSLYERRDHSIYALGFPTDGTCRAWPADLLKTLDEPGVDQMTFGQFKRHVQGFNLTYGATCPSTCGHLQDPNYHLYYQGPASTNQLNIELSGLDDAGEVDLPSTINQDVAEIICNTDLDKYASVAFENVKSFYVIVGYAPLGSRCDNRPASAR